MLQIVALFVMDLTPDDELYKVDPDEHETEEELENSMTKIRKSMSDDDSSRQTGAHIDNGSMVIPLQHAAD